MPCIRQATTDDARFIASCLQQLLGSVGRYTIVGCTGLQNHIVDLIRGDREPNSTFLLCTDRGTRCGVSEWRVNDGRVHLNHIYVVPKHRGKGIGSILLRDGLRYFDPPDDAWVSVDSFVDNTRASDWYATLGLTPASELSWRVRPIASPDNYPHDIHFHGLAEAHQDHLRYGFSQITLEIDGKTYKIGQLGARYFRTTSADFLEHPVAISALGHVDPDRELLSITADTAGPATAASEVARSIRHETTYGRLRNSVSATLLAVGS